jgi:kynurenine 3-monooxygenase
MSGSDGNQVRHSQVATRALADLAVQNFIEMRDKPHRARSWQKKLDHLLERLLPGIYLPLYTMITFTRIPYAKAARRTRLQDCNVYGSLAFVLLTVVLLTFRFIVR